ncbi:hypothetical protein [Xanthovirga aplysinae]|nr:hypothetical protein [Xanthovirga aplysinae]
MKSKINQICPWKGTDEILFLEGLAGLITNEVGVVLAKTFTSNLR